MLIKRKVIATFAIIAMLAMAGMILSRGHSCHSAVAQEEEGNPGHREPTAQCNHKPKTGQVACKCMRHCDPDRTQEDRKCKSYCFPFWCTCPPCA
jgi:hypothetical protein